MPSIHAALLPFHTVHYGPAIRVTRRVELQPALFGPRLNRIDITLQDTAHVEFAATGQRRSITRHVGQKNIPVDIGEDIVVMPAHDPRTVAQDRIDTVGNTVGGDILAAVLIGPLVYVDSIDSLRAAFCRHDGQYARPAAHVEATHISRVVAWWPVPNDILGMITTSTG